MGEMKILKLAEVMDITGIGRSTIYLRIKEGKFPKPVKTGIQSVGWIESEIQTWLNCRKMDRFKR
jgi:prophage regulatory protein